MNNPFGYLQAKKDNWGKYQIYWRGTNNNADINGMAITKQFDTAQEARKYFEMEWNNKNS